MKVIIKIVTFISFSVLLASCGNGLSFLSGKDFSNGKWLLVNVNNAKQTFYVIDNENILRENADGLSIHLVQGQENAECDGSLKLYKNGELIDQCKYLNQSCLIESKAIKEAYRQGSDMWLYPKNQQEYEKLWDSLLLVKNCYPTKFFQKFDNRKAIQVYMYK